MIDFADWSTTPGDNTQIDGTNIAEHCDPANINNALRAQMANLAAFRELVGGGKTSGGSSNAYTLTSGLSLSAYMQGLLLGFEANHTNSGAATLDVDSVGGKAVTLNSGAALSAGDIVSGGIYLVAFETGSDSFLLLNPSVGASQPLDATLTAFAALSIVADKLPYGSGLDAFSLADFTSYGRSIVAAASEAAFKALVNLEAGTDVQGQDALLQSFADLASQAAGDVFYLTAANTVARLAKGSNGQVLTLASGLPSWATPAADTLEGLAKTDGNFVVGNGSAWVVESGATARASLAAAAKSQDDESWYGLIRGTVSNGDYRIVLKARRAGTITETTTRSASGTATATFKVNTTSLGGSANSVSSTEQSQSHSTSNTFAIGDDIVITISSASSCQDMSFSIQFTEALD